MKKMNILRGIALLLAAIMIFTSVPETALTAYAIEEEAELPAAEETVVEQTGTVEETQVTTPEVVEPETTEEVVQLNSAAPEATEEEVQPVEAAPEATGEEVSNLGADASTRTIAINSSTAGRLSGMQYASTSLTKVLNDDGSVKSDNRVIFTVTANTKPGSKELASNSNYDAFTYAFYGDMEADGKTPKGDPISLPNGLEVSLESTSVDIKDSTGTVTGTETYANQIVISGTPKEYIPVGTHYYLVVFDSDNGASTGLVADNAVRDIVVSCSAVNFSKATGDSPLAFGTVQNGYTVNNNSTGITNNVNSKELVFKSTQAAGIGTIDDLRALVIDTTETTHIVDHTPAYTTAQIADLTASENWIADFDSSTLDVTVTDGVTLNVRPVANLKSTASSGTSNYNAYVIVYSEGNRFSPIVYPITFAVETSLAVKKVAQGDTDATADATTVFKGTVGKTIEPIVITFDDYSEIDEVKVTAGTYPAGLTGSLDGNIFRITGKPTTATTANAGAYDEITLTATDIYGKAITRNVRIDVNSAYLTYTAPDGIKISNGTGTSTYKWFAGSGYSAASESRIISITNDTENDVELTSTLTYGSPAADAMTSQKFVVVNGTSYIKDTTQSDNTKEVGTITISAGGSATIEIAPPDEAQAGEAGKKAEATLALVEKDSKVITETISLEFDILATAQITKPYADNDAMTAGEVNVAYEFVPELTRKADWQGSNFTVEWSLDATGAISAANLLKNYGLSFDESTGRIYGTPFASVTNQAIKLKADIKNSAGAVVFTQTRITEITIAKAKSSLLAVYDNKGEKITKTYTLTQQGTDSNSKNVTNFSVASTADVDLAGVQVAITNVRIPDGTNVTTQDGIAALFKVGGTLATASKLKAGETADFTVYENLAPGESGSALTAGTYVLTLKVTGTDIDTSASAKEITTTLSLTIVATPTLVYKNENAQTSWNETLVVDREYKAETTATKTRRFVSVEADGITRSMTYTWRAASGSTIPAGLSLDSTTGQITGTPTQAGIYYVLVKGSDKTTGLSAEGYLTITVTSPKEIKQINFTPSGSTANINIIGKQYVFNGVVIGSEAAAEPQTLDLKVVPGTTALTKKVNITVSGGGSVIKSSEKGLANIADDGTFTITATPGTTAGFYVAEVTLDSDEIVPVSFYVSIAVVDPLTLDYSKNASGNDITSLDAKVGTPIPATYIATAEGGNFYYQKVKIEEVKGVNGKSNVPDGLTATLNVDPTYRGTTYDVDRIAQLTGTPEKTGDYTITLKAKADKVTTLPAALLYGTSVANTGYTTFPELAETTETLSFDVNVAANAGLEISMISSNKHGGTDILFDSATGITGTTEAAANLAGYYFEDKTETNGTVHTQNVVGVISGSKVYNISEYTLDKTSVNYTQEALSVTVANNSGVGQKISAALAGGAESNFVINPAASAGNVNNGNSQAFVIKPKTKLAAGTYDETVTFSSPDTTPITFTVHYTVEASDYKVSASYEDMLGLEPNAAGNNVQRTVHKLIENGKSGAVATEPIEIFVKAGESDPAVAAAKMTVKNAGNETIKRLRVYEVKDAQGTKYADGATDDNLRVCTTPSGSYTKVVSVSDLSTTQDIYVAPKNYIAASDGTVNTFLAIEFQTGSNTSSLDTVIVPVEYTVFKATQATTGSGIVPAAANAADPFVIPYNYTGTKSAQIGTEGIYSPSEEQFVATIVNTAVTAGTSPTTADAFYAITATLDGNDDDCFDIICTDNYYPTSVQGYEYYGYKTIADGDSRVFTVQPKAGLRTGVYETVLKINGGDFSEISYPIVFAVKEDANSLLALNVDLYENASGGSAVFAAGDENDLAAADAARLYNSVVVATCGNSAADGTIVDTLTPGAVGAQIEGTSNYKGHVTAVLKAGATIDFEVTTSDTTGDVNLANVNGVTGAKIYKTNAAIFSQTNVTVDFGNPTAAATFAGTTSCFKTLVLHPYSWVKFDPNGGKFVDSKESIIGSNTDNVAVDAAAAADTTGNVWVSEVYIRVAGGQTVGSVLNTIPSVVKDGYVFKNFESSSAVSTNTPVVIDMTATAAYDQHTYPAADNSKTRDAQEEEGIIWKWSEDGTSVSLTLKCTDEDGHSVTLTGAYGTEPVNYGTENRIRVSRYASNATCEIGSGWKYTATISYGGQSYENSVYVGEKEGALGHTWDWSTFTAALKDGAVDVKNEITCTRCNEIFNTKVEISKKLISEPTCSDEGEYVYLVLANDLDTDGTILKTYKVLGTERINGLNYQYTREVFETIPALGHDYGDQLYVDWKKDSKGNITGIANAYTACSRCGEINNVTGIVNYTAYDATKGYAEASVVIDGTTLTAKGYAWEDKDCTFSNPVWTWSNDGTAILMVDRTNNGVTEKKTYTTTTTPAVKITPKYAALYTLYTASITLEDASKAGSTTFEYTYQIETGAGVGINGEEDGFIEFGFAPSVDWTGVESEHMVYTGAAIKPQVRVTNGSKILTEGVDYTVSYKKNTNAGIAVVTIKGKGNYTGSDSTLTFTIDQKDIDDGDVYVSGNAGVIGKKITPVLTYAGKALGKKDTNISGVFTFKLSAANDEQSYEVSGSGNYTGTRSIPVYVYTKAELKPISATIAKGTSFVYNGEPHVLNDGVTNLTVMDKKAKTPLDEDCYEVSYSNNVDAGTVKVVITGNAPYTGKVTRSFKITPAKGNVIVNSNADALTDVSYVRSGAKPAIRMYDDTLDVNLTEGKDFKVSYSKNKKVGGATATVTFLGNYKGAGTKGKMTVPFTIVPAKLNANNVEVAIQDTLVYNAKKGKASAYFATPFVTLDGVLLTKGKDYNVTYSQGSVALDKKSALTFTDGVATITATISIKDTNNYTSDGKTDATIDYNVIQSATGTDLSKAKVSVVTLNAKGKYVTAKVGYTGDAITFDADDNFRQGTIQLKIDKNTVLRGSEIEENFDITYINNVEKGTATIILTPNNDKYSGSVKGTFKIKAGRITGLAR